MKGVSNVGLTMNDFSESHSNEILTISSSGNTHLSGQILSKTVYALYGDINTIN